MKFPRYVPIEAQEYFRTELALLTPNLATVERQLARIARSISNWEQLCEWCRIQHHSIEDLKGRQTNVTRARVRLWNSRNLLRRLAGLETDDQRIREAYEALRKEIATDGECLRFVAAAYRSVRDYAEYRLRKRQAADLLEQVEQLGHAFLRALRELQRTGAILPPELQNNRRKLFSLYGQSEVEWEISVRQLILTMGAPRLDLVDIVEKAIESARTTVPTFDFEGAIDAAIQKRKLNYKTEYLRAFARLLTNSAGIGRPLALTPGIRRAMAVTSTVAINSDVVVTEDDVRKALGSEQLTVARRRNVPSERKISSR